MSLAKAGGSGCPEMNTIVNITSFIIQPNSFLQHRQTSQHNNSMQQLSYERVTSIKTFTMWRVEVYEEMVCEDVLCGDARRGEEEESGEQGEEEDGEMSWGPPPPCSASSSSSSSSLSSSSSWPAQSSNEEKWGNFGKRMSLGNMCEQRLIGTFESFSPHLLLCAGWLFRYTSISWFEVVPSEYVS